MKRRYFVVIAATAILLLLLFPSIPVSLQCPAEPPEGHVVIDWTGRLPVILYMFYVLNGERINLEGVTCGPWQVPPPPASS